MIQHLTNILVGFVIVHGIERVFDLAAGNLNSRLEISYELFINF